MNRRKFLGGIGAISLTVASGVGLLRRASPEDAIDLDSLMAAKRALDEKPVPFPQFELQHWQKEILKAMQNEYKLTVITHGRGAGKTRALSWLETQARYSQRPKDFCQRMSQVIVGRRRWT